MKSTHTILVALVCVAGGAVGCGSNVADQQNAPQEQRLQINGAGATFPTPIYSKWFDEYNKLKPNVNALNKQSVTWKN